MTFDGFEHLMKGVASFVEAIALFGGGVWAWFTFGALGKRMKAQAEIQGLELDLRKKATELRRLEQAEEFQSVIEMSITAAQQSLPNDSGLYVVAVVEVENKGKVNAVLIYDEPQTPFAVYSVSLGDDGGPYFETVAKYPVPLSTGPSTKVPRTVIRAEGRERFPFFFRVNTPGLYFLVFAAPCGPEDQQIGKLLGLQARSLWAAKEYVTVRPNLNPTPA